MKFSEHDFDPMMIERHIGVASAQRVILHVELDIKPWSAEARRAFAGEAAKLSKRTQAVCNPSISDRYIHGCEGVLKAKR